MGLRDIERKIRTKSAYQIKDAELMLVELDQLIDGFKELEQQLKKFEKKHGDEIKNNKEYYEKLSRLRDDLGLPKELGVYDWKDSPSFVDKLTGKGYFDQLGNDLLEIGMQSTQQTGGLMAVAQLVLKLNKSRPGKIIPPKDVIRALENLVKAGIIAGIRELDSGVKIAEFVAIDLSEDQQTVFSLASRYGYITPELLILKTKWAIERANRVLDSLTDEGIAIKDDSLAEGTKYWFPSLGET